MKWFWRGALVAFIGTFPLAALCAVVYGFPVPMVGWRSGFGAIPAAMYSVVFCGLFGGFVVQGLLGGVAGVVAARANQGASPATDRMCVVLSLIAAAAGVLTLVFSDQLFGQW